MPVLAWTKSDLLPNDETLRWLVRASWQSQVDLRNLRPCPRTRILEVEGHAKTVPEGPLTPASPPPKSNRERRSEFFSELRSIIERIGLSA